MIHKQFVFSGKLRKDLYIRRDSLSDWITDLVAQINMNILYGPISIYSDTTNNEGFTAFVIIDTSHIAVHTWDATGRIEIDIYTCKDFDKEIALTKVLELCESAEYLEIDRTNGLKLV